MKENIKYKRIELTDIVVKPDPKNYGFKSIKEYETVKKHNYKTFLKAIKKSRIAIFLIISIQIWLLLMVLKDNNNFWFVLFIILDIMFLPYLRKKIDSEKKYKKTQNQEKYENDLRKYERIIGDLWYVDHIKEENEKNEKEYNLIPLASYLSRKTYNDLYIIYTFKELKYSHDFVIKLVDELLIKNILQEDENVWELSTALGLLIGLNVISEKESNERDIELKKLIEKN